MFNIIRKNLKPAAKALTICGALWMTFSIPDLIWYNIQKHEGNISKNEHIIKQASIRDAKYLDSLSRKHL